MDDKDKKEQKSDEKNDEAKETKDDQKVTLQGFKLGKNIKNINRNSRSRKDTSSIYFNGTGPELVNADRTMGMSGKYKIFNYFQTFQVSQRYHKIIKILKLHNKNFKCHWPGQH